MTTRILALSALLVFSASAWSQVTPEDPSKNTGTAGQADPMTSDAMWDDLDSNRDGFLTKDELQGSPALVTHFDRLDQDGDGKLSQTEWRAYGHVKDSGDNP